MPTTLTGLLLFVAALLPGFTFIGMFTFDRPRRSMSVLLETAGVLLGSVVAVSVVVGLFVITRSLLPAATVDLDRLIAEPGAYLESEYELVTVWFAGALLAACTLAGVAGWLARRLPVHPSVMSSWWTLFQLWHPGTVRRIQCELDDGSLVEGVLGDWNTFNEDSPDRDLILNAPIRYRPAKDEDCVPHPVSTVCISARRIVAMFVAYSDPEPELDSITPSSPSAPSAVEEAAAPSAAVPAASDPCSPQVEQASSHPTEQASVLAASAHGYDRPRQPPTQVGHAPGPSHRLPGRTLASSQVSTEAQVTGRTEALPTPPTPQP